MSKKLALIEVSEGDLEFLKKTKKFGFKGVVREFKLEETSRGDMFSWGKVRFFVKVKNNEV